MNDKVLYFFTASFPYSKSETFIETEIKYLSGAFNTVYIIPLFAYETNSVRNVPENCIVLKPIIRNRWQHYFLGLFGIRSLKLYANDFTNNKVYKNTNWLIAIASDFCTTNSILQSKALSKIVKKINDDDVLYFYWGKGLANLIPFITKIKSKKIVRFHGGDLYDINYGGYIPIQEQIIKNADLSVFISKNGQNYLNLRYPNLLSKSIVSYLGTSDLGISRKSEDGIFRLLSCSNVIPLKRVELIYDALQNITNSSIEWTHIGDGTEFANLQIKIQNTNQNVVIKLLGRLSNNLVYDYYKENSIDAFINVSSTEGLPVSIMEAISFNVPVIGTDVGGTSEIVNDETGILLNANPTIPEIVKAIKQLHNTHLQPKQFWQKNFSAERNYENFIFVLKNQ